jgi:long-chain acyl-CoA synthetase
MFFRRNLQGVLVEKSISYQDKPWLSHYEEGVKANLDYKEICLPDFLEKSVQEFPDNTAYIFQGYKITFAEFEDMVKRFATCLTEFGIQKGDSVAILLPNLIPCAAAYYGIIKIGAIAVMNNPLYSDRELEHQFNDSNSKVLITLDLLGNRMIDLRPKTKIRQIIYTSIGDYLPFPKNILFPLVAKKKKLAASVKKARDLYKWKDIIKNHYPDPPKTDLTFDDVAMYQYTGGTTGVSKGAILTHGNLSKQAQQINGWVPGLEPGNEVMLGALPFFHVMGLTASLNLAVCNGWTNILVPKPQPEPLLEAMATFRPTIAPLVPTMFIGLLSHPEIASTDLTSIKVCISGSAPLPVEVIKDFEEKTGSIIIEAFGMTESSPATHVNPMNKTTRKIGSIGIPIADTECRIVDLTNPMLDVPPGQPGELVIRGPQVMKGYLNMDNETAKTIIDGWLHTGDIATMDEDGYFYIVDRIKDMIISGGYNVYPRDIDEVLFEHSKIQEACAVGIPHPTRGEQIKAFVVLKEGATATSEEIMAYCKTKLATYKIPTSVQFMDELPKTNVGKVLRKELRKLEIR